MNILSLFDGMSCGRIALERANICVNKYYASEIDKHAIKVSEANYPDIIRLGDVTKWRDWNIDWSSIDLVTGGFPCQAWSMAGRQLGDKDERGMLFWTMLDVMKKVREHNSSAHFLIENVKMKKEFEEYITHHTEQALGEVYKILINSALVSAQNRNRYYWTSFECFQPEDEGILLSHILDSGVVDRDKSWCIDAHYFKGGNLKNYFEKHRRQIVMYQPCRVSERGRRLNVIGTHRDDKNGEVVRGYECATDYKSACLSTVQKDNYIAEDYKIRKLTPIECERLQTVPDNYTACVSNTQRYKMLGNGWTVDVISHLLLCMVSHNNNLPQTISEKWTCFLNKIKLSQLKKRENKYG